MNKMIILVFSFSLIACQASAINTLTERVESEQTEPVLTDCYDALLAAELGADDYGMSQYVMAFLKAGPNRSQDSLAQVKLQAGHMANIQRLQKMGKLVLAGPFLDDGDLKGIFIFAVGSVEEAEELIATDPAIISGRLVMEMHPWYGSAAVKQIPIIHKRIQKIQF